MATYIISRHGKHAANQPEREIVILGTVEAATSREALAVATGRPIWQCLGGQYLRASLWKGPIPSK